MKTFLIIGASSGIGHALANELAGSGHNVLASYRNHEIAQTTNIQTFRWDVADDFPVSVLEGRSLDGVVYCPGSIRLAPFHRIKTEDFSEDFALQFLGAVKTLQAARPFLAEGASVVLFSTVAVETGFPFHSAVSASKGAIEGFVRALAAEWAPKVRVNAIAPSITDTPLAEKLLNSEEKKQANAQRHPLKRIGTAGDLAGTAAFLLSDSSGWVTGQILKVDGGMSAIRI
jgi:NAD(P)-dependent dehydrogenase (short-subunit alcohol dehydrogenase family)